MMRESLARKQYILSATQVRVSLGMIAAGLFLLPLVERDDGLGNWWALILLAPGLLFMGLAYNWLRSQRGSHRLIGIFFAVGYACLLMALAFIVNAHLWVLAPMMIVLGGGSVLLGAVLA